MQQDCSPERSGDAAEGPAEAPAEALALDVVAFLRAHPDFLAGHPGLYDHLVPPARVHGPALADHMQAMLLRARDRALDAERTATETAATRRAAESFTRRVQEAVIAMMRAPDPAWLAIHELASLLRVDAARLCFESAAPPGTATIPVGTVAATLGQRQALVRPALAATACPDPMLHGEAVALAAEEALVRIPLRRGAALLALAARDCTSLAGATTDALAFLGRAVGATLDPPAGLSD